MPTYYIGRHWTGTQTYQHTGAYRCNMLCICITGSTQRRGQGTIGIDRLQLLNFCEEEIMEPTKEYATFGEWLFAGLLEDIRHVEEMIKSDPGSAEFYPSEEMRNLIISEAKRLGYLKEEDD